MKILFVCQQYIHAARWINQLKDTHHEIYVFDCLDRPIHEELKWTHSIENWSKRKVKPFKGEHFLKKKLPKSYETLEPFLTLTAAKKLEELIKEIQPDLVHSLEMQSQTYPVEKVRRKLKFNWAYFSWGSDLYLYKDDPKHRPKIQKVMSTIDYFIADNYRDTYLAKKLGFNHDNEAVYPGGGGYHLRDLRPFIQRPAHERNLILIKGYHHWAGRALHVLEAIETLVDELASYEIYVYSAHPVVVDKIKEINQKHGCSIEYSTRKEEISHEELMEKFGQAKIAIGNSISDGIPNTLLESIVMGAFPIQSNPGGVSRDRITDGQNGFLIENAEDPAEIADKIKRALKDSNLLQYAFEINQRQARGMSYDRIRDSVLSFYQDIEDSL